MKIEKLQSLSDEILDELLIVWEKSVRSSHHFLKEEDIEYFKPLVRDQYFLAVKLFVIRNENGRIAAFMGLSDNMLEMLFVRPKSKDTATVKHLWIMPSTNVIPIKWMLIFQNRAIFRHILRLIRIGLINKLGI